MYEKSAFIFWVTLALYLITLITATYVGVYLTYVALPVIVISGLFMLFAKPKPKTREAIDSAKVFIKESGAVANSALDGLNMALDEVNNSLTKFNKKSDLIRIRTEKLNELKNKFRLDKIEPEVKLKYATDDDVKLRLNIEIEQIERKIDQVDKEICRIKEECELEVERGI